MYCKLLIYRIIFILVLVPGLFRCSREKKASLIFGLPCAPLELVPSREVDVMSVNIIPYIYETLVTFADDSVAIKPLLAEKWESRPDGLQWTFHLRPNIQFHDSTPFCAQAVKISFDRFIEPSCQFFLPESLKRNPFEMIEAIDVIDSLTIQFHLKYNYAPFLKVLCNSARAGIVSPNALKKYGSLIGKHPIGTGPFKFVCWDETSTIYFKHNSTYWGKNNQLNLVFRIVEAPSQRISLLKKAKLHILAYLPPIYLHELILNRNIRIHWCQQFHTYFLGFNCGRPPFNDKVVRQAVAMALNRSNIISQFQGNTVLLANSILPDILIKIEPWSNLIFNPEKARNLLKNKKFNQNTTFKLLCYHATKSRIAIYSETIKEELKHIGLKVEPEYFFQWTKYDSAVKNGAGHLFLDGWKSYIADPDDYFTYLFYSFDEQGTPNLFHFNNSKVDSLIILGRKLSKNPDSRSVVYKQIESILNEEMPCVPLAHRKLCYVLNHQVKNFKTNIVGIPHLEKVTLDAAH